MAKKQHVAVIDPGTRIAEESCYERIASSRVDCDFSYHRPALDGMTSLKKAPAIDIALMFGSGASVHDSLPWQDELKVWLHNYIEAKRPFFGFCYAHQLVAHLYGGKVEFLFEDDTKLKGFRTLSFCKKVFSHPDFVELVVSHREAVTELPHGFELWGSSPEISIDAMCHRKNPTFTVQGHPEADAQFMVNQSIDQPDSPNRFADGHRLIDQFLDSSIRQ